MHVSFISASLNTIIARSFVELQQMTIFVYFCGFRCSDGSIKPCVSSKYGYAPSSMTEMSVISIVFMFIILFLLLTVLFGGAFYILRYFLKVNQTFNELINLLIVRNIFIHNRAHKCILQNVLLEDEISC